MTNKRKIVLALFMIALVLNPFEAVAAPDTVAESYAVFDLSSGALILDKDSQKEIFPGTAAHIMTAILAIERTTLTDTATASKNVPLAEGTKVYLKQGDKPTIESLLYALMFHSANDAAVALAEKVSGSEDKFVTLMNEKAKELGAYNTNFSNARGGYSDKTVTTVEDLALITAYALKNPTFKNVVAAATYDWRGVEWQKVLINPAAEGLEVGGLVGIKTGKFNTSSFYIGLAEKDEQRVLIVVANGKEETIKTDAKKLFDYAFQNYRSVGIVTAGQVMTTLKLGEDKNVDFVAATSLAISTASKETELRIDKQIVLTSATPPFKKDEVVGQAIIFVNGEEQGRVDLISSEKVSMRPSVFDIIVHIFAILFILQVISRNYYRTVNRRKKMSRRKMERQINN